MLFRIVLFLGAAFGFLLPMSTNYSNIALILFYASSIFYIIKNRKEVGTLKFNKLYGSTILLIIPVFLSVLFVGYDDATLQIIVRRITFLLSPTILFFLPYNLLTELKQKSLSGLIVGCFFTSLFLIVKVFNKYFVAKGKFIIDKDLFNYYHTNVHFMSNIDIHSSYYGMFVLFALFALRIEKPIKNTAFTILIYFVLSITVLFINSRIILFLFIVFIIWMLWKEIESHALSYKKVIITIIVSVLIVGTTFYALRNTYVFQRFSKELSWDLSNEIGTKYNSKNSGDSRVARWRLALGLIKDKPFLGYGSSKETMVLKHAFSEKGMDSSAKLEYNAHNQFITNTLEVGIIGLGFIVCFFVYNFYIAWIKHDRLFLFFLFSIVAICLVESYFKRNAGITFVSFFISILLLHNHRNENISEHS